MEIIQRSLGMPFLTAALALGSCGRMPGDNGAGVVMVDPSDIESMEEALRPYVEEMQSHLENARAQFTEGVRDRNFTHDEQWHVSHIYGMAINSAHAGKVLADQIGAPDTLRSQLKIPASDINTYNMIVSERSEVIERELAKQGIQVHVEKIEYGGIDCFLTTACTVARGLPDDCRELTTLRWFRDRVLLQTPSGRAAVREYYVVAPQIVEGVNSLGCAAPGIWEKVYRTVRKTVGLVERGKHDEAFETYRGMVGSLTKFA